MYDSENISTLGFYGPVHEWTHDHSLVLMKNGKIVHFSEVERVTGIKHAGNIDEIMIKLFQHYGINPKDPRIQLVYPNTFSTKNLFKETFDNFQLENYADFKLPPQYKIKPIVRPVNGFWFGKEKQAQVFMHEFAHLCSCLPFIGEFKSKALLIHILTELHHYVTPLHGFMMDNHLNVWIGEPRSMML